MLRNLTKGIRHGIRLAWELLPPFYLGFLIGTQMIRVMWFYCKGHYPSQVLYSCFYFFLLVLPLGTAIKCPTQGLPAKDNHFLEPLRTSGYLLSSGWLC